MHPLFLQIAAAVGARQSLERSILLQQGTVIAWDPHAQYLDVLRNASVLIRNDRIVQVGQDIKPDDNDNTEVVDCRGKIISPGFVDTHHHVWQTALKTLGSNATLAEYMSRYGEYAAAPHYSPDDVYVGEKAGILESLNAGVTTIVDFAHHTWSPETAAAGLRAAIESEGRVYWSYAIHDLSIIGSNFSIDDQIATLSHLADSISHAKDSTVSIGLAYDRFSMADPKEVTEVLDLVKSKNLSLITTHAAGWPFGPTTSPTLLHSYGALEQQTPIIFAHSPALEQGDLLLLRQYNHYISETPESEMHFGTGQANSDKAIDQMSLGVDCHMAMSADIITQARMWLQKVRDKRSSQVLSDWQVPSYQSMSVNQAFLLATQHGGLALNRTDIGVIREGAKADLVVFNTDSPGLLAWNDPVAAIILHSNVGDIESVLIDGNFVKKDFKLLNEDYHNVREGLRASAERLQRIWKSIPYPVMEGTWRFAPGVSFAAPQVVDAQRGHGTGLGSLFLR